MVANCVAYRSDGTRIGDITLDAISDVLEQPDTFVWVGLIEPDEALLEKLQEEFGLHDLAIEDAHNAHQRPKIEAYGDSLFIVAQTAQVVGASIEFDFLGMSFTPMEKYGEAKVIDLLLELLHRGHADRILLSHDVCHNSQLRRFEGNGYVYLSNVFLPRLRERGVSEAEIAQITVANPRRVLTIG